MEDTESTSKRKYEFVESLHSRYECSICTFLLENPIQIVQCGHRFCEECFETWKKRFFLFVFVLCKKVFKVRWRVYLC